MAEMKPNVAVLPSQGLRRAATPSGVTHVREYQSDRYSIVGNHLAQHRALSLTAIGLAVYILSLPEGSPTDIRTLAERFPEGRDRIAFALRELEVCGYLARVWERTADGRMITRTYAYNAPVLTRERVHSVATSSAGSAVTAQVPATPASAVPPTALVLVDGPTEPVRPWTRNRAPPNRKPPNRIRPSAAALRQGRGSPGGAASYRPPTDAVPAGRASPRSVRHRLVRQRCGQSDAIHALTADLPALVKHPAGFLARRLRELLPPPLPSLTEPGKATAQGNDAPSGPPDGHGLGVVCTLAMARGMVPAGAAQGTRAGGHRCASRPGPSPRAPRRRVPCAWSPGGRPARRSPAPGSPRWP
ncbi:hypothetical protein SHIRM173S_09472 [Streptomyces hirsutus]